jgi:hypothetical protein
MSRHVWAQSELKWDGFEPKAYVLDNEKIWKLQLTNASSKEQMTIGGIVEAFRGQKVELDDNLIELEIKSESRALVVKGPSFHQDLLKRLYWFSDHGVSPFDVRWFYYDSDSVRDDPHEAYFFFLVADHKILDERVMLSDHPESGFDPTVLMSASNPELSIWRKEPQWDGANDRLWYRKFYTETRTGGLMVLRPDEPVLYHYPEGRSKAGGRIEGWLSEIRGILARIKFAIWALVALTVLQIFLRWK